MSRLEKVIALTLCALITTVILRQTFAYGYRLGRTYGNVEQTQADTQAAQHEGYVEGCQWAERLYGTKENDDVLGLCVESEPDFKGDH